MIFYISPLDRLVFKNFKLTRENLFMNSTTSVCTWRRVKLNGAKLK